jgi:hypothetical protein
LYFLATHGCPKQLHVVKKIHHKPKSKVQRLYALKDFIHGCIQEKEPEEREDWDSADDESRASTSTALTLQDTQMTTDEGSS